MEADFDRYYGRDLASLIWIEEWPSSRLFGRVVALPEESAFVRSITKGHTSLHEVIAQVRDAVVTTAHGYRMEGKPRPFQRPGLPERDRPTVDPTQPEHAADIKRFFGKPR